MNSNEDQKGNRSHVTQIILALITLVGVLGGALFANWDKVFPPKKTQPPLVATPPPVSPAPSVISPAPPQTSSISSRDSPRPNIIILEGTEKYEVRGKQFKRYQLVVTNWASYPVELFKSAPDLPPCGLNKNSSRTWVDIYDALKQVRIYGFCALSSPESLNGIWFSVEQGESPPRTIYIKLVDRRKNLTYISDTIELK